MIFLFFFGGRKREKKKKNRNAHNLLTLKFHYKTILYEDDIANLKMQSPDIIVKIAMEGVYTAGKTSLMIRCAENIFSSSHNLSNIGVDFKIKKMMLSNTSYKLQIWDKPNTHHRFQYYNRSYYRNASGVIYVFDCINQPYDDLERSIPEMRKYLPNEGYGIPIIIAYTKIDLASENEKDPPERLVSFAKVNNLKIVCCSSKTGIGVDEVFSTLISEMNSNSDYWKAKEELDMIEKIRLIIGGKQPNSFCL